MRPQQALIQREAQARRIGRVGEGIVAAVQVVEVFRLREVFNVVLYAFNAFLRRQTRHGRLHPSARSGEYRRKPVARIVVFSARPNMIDCICLIIVVGIPIFLRRCNLPPVAVNVKPELVSACAVVAVRVRPCEFVAAELFVFVVVAVVRRLHVIRRFHQRRFQRPRLGRHAFQMNGSERHAGGHGCPDIQLFRAFAQEGIAARREIRPRRSIIRIRILAVFYRFSRRVDAERFQTNGIRFVCKLQRRGLPCVCRVQRGSHENRRSRTASVKRAVRIQTQRRSLMSCSVLKGKHIRRKAVAVPLSVHVQALNRQLRRTVRREGRHGFRLFFFMRQIKRRHRPKQSDAEMNGIRFVYTHNVQTLKNRSRPFQMGANRHLILRRVKFDIVSFSNRRPRCAVVGRYLIGDRAARRRIFNGMQSHSQHRLRGCKVFGHQCAGIRHHFRAHIRQCKSVGRFNFIFVFPDIAQNQRSGHALRIMQRALTVKRKHGEGMNAVFRVENRVYREFQMGRCAARLSVQHENAAALRAAVIGGIFALLIGDGQALALLRRGNRYVCRNRLCAVIGLDVYALNRALVRGSVMRSQDDFNGFSIRKFTRVQHAELFGQPFGRIGVNGHFFAGRAFGRQRPVRQRNIRDNAPNIQNARHNRAVLRRKQLDNRRSVIQIDRMFPCRSVFKRIRQTQRNSMFAVRQPADFNFPASVFVHVERFPSAAVNGILHPGKTAVCVRRAFPRQHNVVRRRPCCGFNGRLGQRRRAAVDLNRRSPGFSDVFGDIHAPDAQRMQPVRKRRDIRFISRTGFIGKPGCLVCTAVPRKLHAIQIVQIGDIRP